MELTKKWKNFVGRQDSKQSLSAQDILPSQRPLADANYLREKGFNKAVNNPEIEGQILESIEAIYYTDKKFDSSEYELSKLPETLELGQIDLDREKLGQQLYVVTKRVSDLILQNQKSYTAELERVTELQNALEEAVGTCVQGRRYLNNIQRELTSASLTILANYSKREKLKCLLQSLHTIKTLQETDVKLRELLDDEDYTRAIQLCLECQRAASTFKHFTCISELHSKLQDTLEMTEEQLDVALSKVCVYFDLVHYQKLQSAYKLLGKTHTATDQLLMYFSTAIHTRAFTIVLGYVELYSENTDLSSHKRLYADLCKSMPGEGFLPCLRDLCKALWVIMFNYWQILEWHQENCPTAPESSEDLGPQGNYVMNKLRNGLMRVWQDVQLKVKGLIETSDISRFKFDQFIKVLDIIQRLIEVGEEFCESKSEELHECIRRQTVNYFRNYHRGCMDELRMFLENESWDLCPVKTKFNILQLHEFHFLRNNISSLAATPDNENPHKQIYFQSQSSNPFDLSLNEDDEGKEEQLFKDEISGSESDSEEPQITNSKGSLTINGSNHKTVKSEELSSSGPILTNTTLNVLRLFGKYMRMMSVLQTIAFDVLICLSHLYDYYTYTVFIFFAQEAGDVNENTLSNKLRTVLKRTEDNLILKDQEYEDRTRDRVPAPSLAPHVNLDDVETLFDLRARVVATESLMFLTEQLRFLQPQLEQLIPPSKRQFMQQFCTQAISTSLELRLPVYMIVSAKSIDFDMILTHMATVRYDIHDIMSQHSPYVDILLRSLQVFSMRMNEISQLVPIPKQVYEILWQHCIKLVSRTFIEGFSMAKKCTNEGRALMQLDYQQFLSKLEHITDLHPIPDKDMVEGYIKAYYYLEPSLEQWIKSHKEYSNRQLSSLVSCVSQLNKKGKQRLLGLLEEVDRPKR